MQLKVIDKIRGPDENEFLVFIVATIDFCNILADNNCLFSSERATTILKRFTLH